MKIRFEFEIDPHKTEDVEPMDVIDCDTIEGLRFALLDWPEPSWRVDVCRDDLEALWAEVQKLQAAKDKPYAGRERGQDRTNAVRNINPQKARDLIAEIKAIRDRVVLRQLSDLHADWRCTNHYEINGCKDGEYDPWLIPVADMLYQQSGDVQGTEAGQMLGSLLDLACAAKNATDAGLLDLAEAGLAAQERIAELRQAVRGARLFSAEDDACEIQRLKSRIAALEANLARETELRREAEADLASERSIYCDKPEDRLWHAEDQTWWRRNERGRLVQAGPPEHVGDTNTMHEIGRFDRRQAVDLLGKANELAHLCRQRLDEIDQEEHARTALRPPENDNA